MLICILGLLAAGCGPAGEQAAERILSGAAETTVANITVVADTPAPTLDVKVVVSQTFAAMTARAAGQKQPATPAPTKPAATPVSPSGTGGISGALNYPGSSIPPMHVVAFRYGSESYTLVTTSAGQSTYEIDGLPAGTYWVIAYTIGGNGFPDQLPGGYTRAVPCGLSVNCTDHTMLDVPVQAGAVTPNVNPWDWYAPPGTFIHFPQG
jgi:hypothetical protein